MLTTTAIIERIDSLTDQASIFLATIDKRTYCDVVELAKWRYSTISLIEKIPISNTIKTEILDMLSERFYMSSPNTVTIEILIGYLEGIKLDIVIIDNTKDRNNYKIKDWL